MRILERNVRGRVGRFMRARNWSAFTMPLPFIGCCIFYWLLDGEDPSPRTRRHELVHAAQISRLGPVRFALSYLWEMRHGYDFNKYELEAYASERRDERTETATL